MHRGDTITIPIPYTSDKIPYIQIHINDKNGNQITIRGLLDRFNGATTQMNSTLEAKLGLNPTGNGTAQGIAGGSVPDLTANLTANETGTPVGGRAATMLLFTGPWMSGPIQTLGNDEVLLGADFLASASTWLDRPQPPGCGSGWSSAPFACQPAFSTKVY